MKKYFLFIGLLFSFLSPALAVKEFGNGGHVWVCRTENSFEVEAILSIDVIEAMAQAWSYARESNQSALRLLQFKLKAGDPFLNLRKFQEHLTSSSPYLAGLLNPHIEHVIQIARFVPGPLDPTEDLNYIEDGTIRTWPQGKPYCHGDLSVRQAAVYYPSQDLVYFDSNFWESNKFSQLQKFGLLLHEAMYSFARSISKVPPNEMSSHEAGLMVAQLLYNQDIKTQEAYFRNLMH